MAKDWFGDIPETSIQQQAFSKEPKQEQFRFKEISENVPVDTIYLAFHIPERASKGYYPADFLSDILGNGKSSRLYKKMVLDDRLFLSIDAYVTGDTEPGLLIIEGKLSPGTLHEKAAQAIWVELELLKSQKISSSELTKIRNQMISSVAFSNTSLLNNVLNLSFCEHLGDINLINSESDIYSKVSPEDLLKAANQIFTKSNCSQLNIIGK